MLFNCFCLSEAGLNKYIFHFWLFSKVFYFRKVGTGPPNPPPLAAPVRRLLHNHDELIVRELFNFTCKSLFWKQWYYYVKIKLPSECESFHIFHECRFSVYQICVVICCYFTMQYFSKVVYDLSNSWNSMLTQLLSLKQSENIKSTFGNKIC